MKCPLCHRKANALVCASCWSATVERLAEIPAGYQALEEELIPSKGVGERVGGSKTPPIPVKLEVLHLRTYGIKEPLMIHETRIRVQQRHTKITFRGDTYNFITQSCEYLVTHSEWIKENYTEIDALAKDVQGISRSINAALGNRSDLMTIGTCPAMDEDGEICNYRLQVNPTTITTFSDIVCQSCGATWSSTQWRMLGRVIDGNFQGSTKVTESKPSDPVSVD